MMRGVVHTVRVRPCQAMTLRRRCSNWALCGGARRLATCSGVLIQKLKWTLGAMFEDPFAVRDVAVAVREVLDHVLIHADCDRAPARRFPSAAGFAEVSRRFVSHRPTWFGTSAKTMCASLHQGACLRQARAQTRSRVDGAGDQIGLRGRTPLHERAALGSADSHYFQIFAHLNLFRGSLLSAGVLPQFPILAPLLVPPAAFGHPWCQAA